MEIIVTPTAGNPARGELIFGSKRYPCALGKDGMTHAKIEGDHKTPAGEFPLRSVFYRFDKLNAPLYTEVPMMALLEEDGWCDDPRDKLYNKPVMLPYHASTESLWRDDDIYDVIVVLGHNDDPAKAGKGSAIFLHVANDDFKGTEGCIALKKEDLLEILPILKSDTTLKIHTH